MSLRRTLATGTSALALSVLLAACGSQLDPETVAAANGSSVNMGAGSVAGEVLPDGTVVGGDGSTAGGGGSDAGTGGDTGSTGGGGGTSTPTLTSGQSITSSGAAYDYDDYVINIPAGTALLTITSSGGTGDADLYLMRGDYPDPEYDYYDYRSIATGNNENITVTNPTAGTWYLTVYGYTSYSGVTVTATW